MFDWFILPDPNELITAHQVASRLGTNSRRVYSLARTGLLPAVRMGRRVMFDRKQIEAWIQNGGVALAGGWRRKP